MWATGKRDPANQTRDALVVRSPFSLLVRIEPSIQFHDSLPQYIWTRLAVRFTSATYLLVMLVFGSVSVAKNLRVAQLAMFVFKYVES